MIIFTLLATISRITPGGSDDELQLMKRIKARDADAPEERMISTNDYSSDWSWLL